VALAYRHDRTPMPDGPLAEDELAREHRSLGVVAWFDGWGQGMGMQPGAVGTYPRRLNAAEQASWREGHAEGVTDRKDQERRNAEFSDWAAQHKRKEAGRGRRPRNADRA